MDLIEKKFRDTPNEHRKYSLRLSNYIEFLFEKGRYHEAKFFFDILFSIKPNNIRTIKLGYDIAITLFDNDSVRDFDARLYHTRSGRDCLNWFRLKYYISVNNYKNSEEMCISLLSGRIGDNIFFTIFNECESQNNYNIAINILKYLKRENLQLNSKGVDLIKKILIKKLLVTLRNV